MSEQSILEEGVSHLLTGGEDSIYTIDENPTKKQKLFICISFSETPDDNESLLLYRDSSCSDKFSELRHKGRFNNIFIFDAEEKQKLYLKTKYEQDYILYYKYCSEEEVNKVKKVKDPLKVIMKENKGNGKVKIEFDSPYENNSNINMKYSIYVSEGGKNYKIMKDLKLKETKIAEDKKEKLEIELDVDTSQKNHFVYVVAETKDPNVSLRPKVIYVGDKIPKKEKESNDTVINAILIVLIIITLIYKIYKRRKKMMAKQGQEKGEANPLI